jgi:phage terminase Nu1 subunit (DNA packaging protein)
MMKKKTSPPPPHVGVLVSQHELCQRLNSTPLGEVITASCLGHQLKRAGLLAGERVDLVRYAAWLAKMRHVKHGAHSIAAVARHFGVSERTVHLWRGQGAPIRASADGYDLAAIEAWRAEHVETEQSGGRAKAEEERAWIRAAKERIQLERLKGEIIPFAFALSVIERHAAEVRRRIEELPEYVESLLPDNEKLRAWIRARVEKRIEKICDAMAEAAEELTRDDLDAA